MGKPSTERVYSHPLLIELFNIWLENLSFININKFKHNCYLCNFWCPSIMSIDIKIVFLAIIHTLWEIPPPYSTEHIFIALLAWYTKLHIVKLILIILCKISCNANIRLYATTKNYYHNLWVCIFIIVLIHSNNNIFEFPMFNYNNCVYFIINKVDQYT